MRLIIFIVLTIAVGCREPKSGKNKPKLNELQFYNAVSDLNGDTVNLKNIINGNALLVLVNPECQICTFQLNDLMRLETEIKDIILVILSHVDITQFNEYNAINSFYFNTHKTFWVSLSEQEAVEIFGSLMSPQILLYREGILIKHFNGEVGLKRLRESLKY